MAFKNISVVLSANVASYKAQMASAAKATRDVADEAVKAASRTDAEARKTLDTIGRIAVATSVALAIGFGLAANEAINFERSMRNVNSISGMTERQLQQTGDAVLELAREVPQSANLLAEGLYDIASSGFQGAEGLEVLDKAAKAASAGLTTTQVSAKAITAVLNAYGLSADEAGRVSDVLFQTVNKGVVTFEELAVSLGDWVGAAAAAGVPIEDASAALATMTLAGISAAESGTSLNQVFRALIDPSDALSEVLAKAGYQSGQLAIEQLGLKGTMDLLRGATGGQIEQLVKLFPEIRAARGALALMAAEGRNYNNVADAFTDKTKLAGVTAAVLAEQSKSVSYQLGVARSSLGSLAVEMGNKLLPAIKFGAEQVKGLADGLADLPDGAQTGVAAMGGLITVATGVGGAFVLLAPKIKAAKDLFNDLSSSAPRLANALKLSSIGIAGATAVLTIGALILSRYAQEKAKARAETEKFVDWLRQEKDGVEGATEAGIIQELQNRKVLRTMRSLGVETRDVVDAVLNNQDAVRSLSSDLLAHVDTIGHTAEIHGALTDALNGSDKAYEQLKSALAWDGWTEEEKRVLDVVKAVGGLSDSHQDAAIATRDLDSASREVGAGAQETRQQLALLGDETKSTTGETEKLTDAQKALRDGLEEFVDPAQLYRDLLRDAEQTLRDAWEKQRDQRIRQQEDTLGEERRAFERRIEQERRALDDQLTIERDALDARKDLTDEQRTVERDAFDRRTTDSKRALDDKQAAEKVAFDRQEEQTKRGRDDWDEFQASVKISLSEYAKTLEEQIKNQENWQRNLVIVASRAGSGVALQLAEMGEEGVELVAAMADGTDEEVQRMAAALTREAKLGGDGAADEIEKAMLVLETLTQRGGGRIVDALRKQLADGKITVGQIVADYGYVLDQGVTTMVESIGRLNKAFADLGANLRADPTSGQVVGPGGQVIIQLGPGGSFADGGIRRAGVARSPMVLFGEPETGGEAFIPLGSHKRSRSVPVLHETARALGFRAVPMADGGLIGRSTAINTGAGASIDYDQLARAVARNVQPGMTIGKIEVKGTRDPEYSATATTRAMRNIAFLSTGRLP